MRYWAISNFRTKTNQLTGDRHRPVLALATISATTPELAKIGRLAQEQQPDLETEDAVDYLVIEGSDSKRNGIDNAIDESSSLIDSFKPKPFAGTTPQPSRNEYDRCETGRASASMLSSERLVNYMFVKPGYAFAVFCLNCKRE
jgi:hypothetical protein